MAQTLCIKYLYDDDVGCMVTLVASISSGLGACRARKSHLIHQIFHALSLGLEHGITSLIACAVALLLWSNYVPAKSVKRTHEKDVTDYARYFELDETQIHQGRAQKISVVHHDEMGRITHID
jgi:poly-beta-1,6-N-acetyl-D-glucosamine biosynthesis protein PgaD